MNLVIFAYKSFGLKGVKKVLSKKDVNPAINDNEAIKWASEFGHTKLVKLLLAEASDRVNPSAEDNYAIRMASRNGYTEVVKLLLADSRVDPSAEDNYAVKTASFGGFADVVKLLLADPRVNPLDEINYAIVWAFRNGHNEVVKLLEGWKPVQPKLGDTESKINLFGDVEKASAKGDIEIVKLCKECNPVQYKLSNVNTELDPQINLENKIEIKTEFDQVGTKNKGKEIHIYIKVPEGTTPIIHLEK